MRLIMDIVGWAALFIFFMSGAARAAFDGALFAYYRPKIEALIKELPDVIQWML